MERSLLLLALALALLASTASAKIVEQTFHVGNFTVEPLCKEQVIVGVNKKLPGPVVRVNEGDTLVVHVLNESPYNITIHWHGVFQLRSAWADGPAYVTQCPILPGGAFTYRFNVTGQEGTLWWHAHTSYIRATVYGAIIIRPRAGRSYPFPKPHREFPIVLGEWWDANVVDLENAAEQNGSAPPISDAYTINGKAGDLYPCNTTQKTHKIKVVQGKTYMLRIVNSALMNQLFFKVAGHNLTVVAIDAAYTNPYNTDVVVIAPGQTTDVLFVADQSPGRYYMAAHPYSSAPNLEPNNSTTTAIVEYENSSTSSEPVMPVLPDINDTPTAHRFFTNLTGLVNGESKVPKQVDEQMFVTIGLGVEPCEINGTCAGPSKMSFSASMNNVSFQPPSTLSMLEAHYFGVDGIYTQDFPNEPPTVFDYTNPTLSNATLLSTRALWTTIKGTRVKRLAYNSTVEIVLQNTAILGVENHPMHLHGVNFFVVAQGFGNFNRATDERKFNLANPQERNTIAVPVGGWAVIRFRADNPGMWFMHCHLEAHVPWGLATVFQVDNGPTPLSTLPPPPSDLPRC